MKQSGCIGNLCYHAVAQVGYTLLLGLRLAQGGVFDDDMKIIKETTDKLEKDNTKEKPGYVTVKDDLINKDNKYY